MRLPRKTMTGRPVAPLERLREGDVMIMQKQKQERNSGRTLVVASAMVVALGSLGYGYVSDTRLKSTVASYETKVEGLNTSVKGEKDRADSAEKSLKEAKYVLGDGKCEWRKGEPQGVFVTGQDGKAVLSDCGTVAGGRWERDNESDKRSPSYSKIDELCQTSEKPEKNRYAMADVPENGSGKVFIRETAWIVFSGDDKVKNSTDSLGREGVMVSYNLEGDDRTEATARYKVTLYCPGMFGKARVVVKTRTPVTVQDKPPEPVPTQEKPPELVPTAKCVDKDIVTNDARSQLCAQMNGRFESLVAAGPVRLAAAATINANGVALSSGKVSANGTATSESVNFNGVSFNSPPAGAAPCTVTVTCTLRSK